MKKTLKIEERLKKLIDAKTQEMNPISSECIKEVSIMVKQLNDFINGTLSLSKKAIEERLASLIGFYTITLDIPIDSGLQILRGRKYEEGKDVEPCFKTVDELSSVPSERALLGRLNQDKESIFYGCIYSDKIKGGVNVAFSEINAQKLERVNLLRSQTKDKIILRYIGIWDYVYRNLKPYFISEANWQYYKSVDKYMQKKFKEEVLMAFQICDTFFLIF